MTSWRRKSPPLKDEPPLRASPHLPQQAKTGKRKPVNEVIRQKRGKHYTPKSVALGKVGRTSLMAYDDRVEFVATLVSKRLSYAQIAKALAERYNMTRKGAYLWLVRLTQKAAKQFDAEVTDDVMINVFQRIVLSLEDSIREAKVLKDWKTAISGDLALARLFGFYGGVFLAAYSKARKERRSVKQVESFAASKDTQSVIDEMFELQNRQLQAMTQNPKTQSIVEEGEVDDDRNPIEETLDSEEAEESDEPGEARPSRRKGTD